LITRIKAINFSTGFQATKEKFLRLVIMNRLVKSIIFDDACERATQKINNKIHNKKESDTSLSIIFVRIFL
jgi:hypothetical protein